MKTSETVTKLYADYIKAQVELKNPPKDKKGQYKYTSLDRIIEDTKPVLAKHNLAIIQMPIQHGLISRLVHSSGEWIETELVGDAGEPRGMNVMQLQGSQLTYFRRYAWASICGIASDDDLDANAPKEEVKQVQKVDNSKVSAKQVTLIQTRLSKLKIDEDTVSMLKTHYNIESWKDFPAVSMPGLLEWLDKKETA